jgi:polyvinyl alcohol dehydrogenase (cytochrome)
VGAEGDETTAVGRARARGRTRRGTRAALGVALLCAVAAGLAACSSDDTDAGSGGAGADADAVAGEGRAGDWPRVGFDLTNTRAAPDESIGAGDVVDLAPAWQLGGVKGVTGTPVVADGTVYVGDWTSHVRALDAATGEERWAHDLESGYVGGSVAVDDDNVFVGAFDARVVALDRATGEPAWETDLDPNPKAVVFGSPVVAGGLVVTGVGSFEVFVPSDPPSFRGTVVALDAATGAEAWRFHVTDEAAGEGAGVSVWSSPAIDRERGVLYIGTGQAYSLPAPARSDSLVALDLATGEEVWHRQFTAGDAWSVALPGGLDADVGAMPNLFTVDATDAVGVGDKAGTYRALDRDTGDVLWEAPLTPGGLQGGVMASAAVAGGTVYVASNDRSQDADLVALDAGTGDEVWRVGIEAHVTGPVTWANGVLYVADDSGRIAAYDAADGARLWAHEVAFPAAGGISVVDGTVYAGWGWWLAGEPDGADGGLIAFRLGGGDAADASDTGGMASAGDRESGDDGPDGRELYQARCASCHGGNGEGSSGPSLAGVADRLTIEDHVAVVRDGRGEMPGWDGSLSDEEIEAVVEYERLVLSEAAGGG